MKIALITGGARGIGADIVRVFSNANYYTIINYNNSKKEAEAIEREINAKFTVRRCEIVKADISNESQVASMVASCIKKTNKIDVLINNAGIGLNKLITETSLDEWKELMDINVNGTFLVSRYVLEHMIRRKSGNIINISSIWGMTGASCEVCYSASKGAIIGFTKALAKEVGPSNIRVNCVAPGIIDSGMMPVLNAEERERLLGSTCLGIFGKGVDVANACLFLASDEAGFITGQTLSPNGGIVI